MEEIQGGHWPAPVLKFRVVGRPPCPRLAACLVGARPTDLKLIVMLMRVFMVNVFEKHAFS